MLFHDSLNGVARALRCRHFYADGVTPSTPGSFSAASQQQNRTIYDRTDGFDPAFEGDYYVITGRYQGAFEDVDGTTDIHATARLAIQLFGRFNNQDWLAESPWRGGLSRIACVHCFRAEQSAFNGDSIDDYDQIANRLFKQKRSARSAVILCGLREEKVLRSPWVMGGVVALGHPRNSAEQYAVDASLPFLGQRANSGTSVFNAGSKALAGLLTIDQYPNQEHAVLVVPAGGAVKLAIAYHVTQAKFFSVITAGYETLVASNATAFTPSPGWSRGSRSISVRFFSFATLAEEISAELAARNDAGVTGRANTFNLILGGVDNVTPSAMVASESPFDFGEKCVRSFYSTSIQRLLAGDASFEHPNYAFLNCENVLGLGAASARLETQERVTNTEDRAYVAPNESLVHDGLSYVELKSSRHRQPQQPFDDEDVTFPIVTTQGQDTFRFRGKSITGTGLRFVPWSSNTFASPIQSYALPTQSSVPSNTLSQVPQDFSVTRDGSTFGRVEFSPPQNENGTWFSRGAPGFTFESRVDELGVGGTPQGTVSEVQDAGTPSNSSRRFYDVTATTLPIQTPGDFAAYAPNTSFDEHSYIAGALVAACPYSYSFGNLAENAQPQSTFGYTRGQFSDNHPAAWPGSGTQRAHAYIDGQRFGLEVVFDVGARVFMPSLAGKEFVCGRETVADNECQAGLFHSLDAGESFSKTGTLYFAGQRLLQTYSNINFVPFPPQGPGAGFINYTVSFNSTAWTGKVEHACTFNTKTVELFIKWSAALQSPGPYKVTPPHEVNTAGLTYGRAPSLVAPAMWVKTEDVDSVTPILVAEVWARAVGEVDVSSTYTFPEIFGTSGTYKHKVIAATAQTFANNSTPVSIDLEDAVIGHVRTFDKDALVSPQAMDMRYLGAFPFNRAQTQRLLDGETVTPTYWFLDDEGTALESQPVTVPWHNDTFGTYKLEFRLMTE
jgi:hypothetical protein